MTEIPFQILIKKNYGEKKPESVTCKAILRTVPGKRDVYDALWHNKGVILKVFSRGLNGRRHLNREWQGLVELHERGLNSPKPLFWGSLEDGSQAVVQEKILNALTMFDIFTETNADGGKLGLLIKAGAELAKQHSRGVLQKDFHLGNFLLREGEIFTIDPSEIRFYSDEIGKNRSLIQLAELANALPEEDESFVKKYMKNISGYENGICAIVICRS